MRFWGGRKVISLVIFDENLQNSASPQPKSLISGPAILIWSPLSFGDDGDADCGASSRDRPGGVSAPWGSQRTPGESAHPGGVSQKFNFCVKNLIFASTNGFLRHPGGVGAPWGSQRTLGESAHPGGVSQRVNFLVKNLIFDARMKFLTQKLNF